MKKLFWVCFMLFGLKGYAKQAMKKIPRIRGDYSISADQHLQKKLNNEEGNWKGYLYCDLIIQNKSPEEIGVRAAINNKFWHDGAVFLAPEETDTLRLFLKGYKASKEITQQVRKMKSNPNGYMYHWEGMKTESIKSIDFYLIGECNHANFEVLECMLHGTLGKNAGGVSGKELFPFMDEYGQYIHTNWARKIHNEKDFELREKEEVAFLNKCHRKPLADEFYGYPTTHTVIGNGHWQTKKIDNKWWLITPKGNLFWSMGVTCIKLGHATTSFTERTKYFSNSPESLTEIAKTQKHLGKISFGIENLKHKYGANWHQKSALKLGRRLDTWGINTFGNWSDIQLARDIRKPYVVPVHYGCSDMISNKLPNVCNPEFEKQLSKSLTNYKKCNNDSFCIGVFVNNEIHGWENIKPILAKGKNQFLRNHFIELLKAKYKSIADLNKKWNSNYKSWGSISELKQNKLNAVDFDAFESYFIDRYYIICKRLVKDILPNKLYLGSRLDFHEYPKVNKLQQKIVKIAAKHCDILSFNRYSFNVADFKMPKQLDVPVLIGEFHFGALDRGLLNVGLKGVTNQVQRAEMYEKYMLQAIKNRNIVGAHWFQYQDQLVTGRGDGENYQIGFIDVCDTPYYELIEKGITVSKQLYPTRLNQKN
ncbi:hypothetical protein EMN47_12060 [Prolixibacteraceae bacterium JC049]|nr:hypothetical protein [Prolixibacteraceae bacterium JC049]